MINTYYVCPELDSVTPFPLLAASWQKMGFSIEIVKASDKVEKKD